MTTGLTEVDSIGIVKNTVTGYERWNGWTGDGRTDWRTWWRYHRFSKVLLNPKGFNQKVKKNKIEEIRSLFFLSNTHACFHLFLRDVVVVFGYGFWFSNLCHQQDPTSTPASIGTRTTLSQWVSVPGVGCLILRFCCYCFGFWDIDKSDCVIDHNLH